MSNIIAFIPARGGSKSIPLKNIKELGGKPLVVWSIEAAFRAGLQRVVVSTDHDEIARVAREVGAEVLVRPAELAQDNTSMYQTLASEVFKIDPVPELVVLLQPTTPFRKPHHIRTATSLLVANIDRFDSLIACEQVPEKYNPAQVMVITPFGARMANGTPISNRVTRRQDFSESYTPTGGFYIFKPENLKKGSIYGEKVMMYVSEGSININSLQDWESAEEWIQKSKL